MPKRSLLFLATVFVLSLAYAATQWSVQPKESSLGFTATQAGAKFDGRFDKFSADIRFDPADLAGSRFDVRIDMTSVNTQDAERDDTLRGADLFNVAKSPAAQYVAEQFTDKGTGKFSATGQLTLRNVTRPVPIEFSFEKNADGAWLKGTASIRRLDFGVGQGEWKDTDTVGNDVQIHFALRLK
jgi:polyisoprenoid-binding protein YceI